MTRRWTDSELAQLAAAYTRLDGTAKRVACDWAIADAMGDSEAIEKFKAEYKPLLASVKAALEAFNTACLEEQRARVAEGWTAMNDSRKKVTN